MATKQNIRTEYTDEDRNLDFDPSLTNPVSVGRQDIWITQELKLAAIALKKTLSINRDEQMTEARIEDVDLKFDTHKKRAEFFDALGKLATLVNPNFPRTYPLHKPCAPESSTTADGVWLNFWYKYFLPDVFATVIEDVAATEQQIIPAPSEVVACAQSYLAAYDLGFIRMALTVDENVDQGAVDSLTESLRETQSGLTKFLRLLVQCLAGPETTRVVIHNEDQIEVNGVTKEFTGAALKALLTLILLRDQAEFKLQDFAKLFHGEDAGDAKTDFDNAMKALKKMLPSISSSTPSKNLRAINGLKFLVLADKALIFKRLKRLNGI